jgi:lipopolysaccharide biosynthesis protein
MTDGCTTALLHLPTPTDDVSLLAFYLPQFHPIPENDAWWGDGFTEWTNVAAARPLFPGHHQPHVPGELGFYDLRLSESREAQANLAREHGVFGFCYYHYWFAGQRLLRRPLDAIRELKRPEFPFCLCWANEDWTRAWDGRTADVLMPQAYSGSDDLEHIRWLAEVFEDARYVRVLDRPLFLVYRARKMPDPRRTTDVWRAEASRLGVGDIYLCCVESMRGEQGDPSAIGFDAAVEFQPDWRLLDAPLRWPRAWRLLAEHGRRGARALRVYEYETLVDRTLDQPMADYTRFPCVTPSWDNTPRRGARGLVLLGSRPAAYERWLTASLARAPALADGRRLAFVNAWNEWGEGNHLEPDRQYGRAYLEATQRAVASASTAPNTAPSP